VKVKSKRGTRCSARYTLRNVSGVITVDAIFELALTLLIAWFVWRFITRLLKRPASPAEAEPDDFAGSPARIRPRPKLGAGAVAVAEPDEENEVDAIALCTLPPDR